MIWFLTNMTTMVWFLAPDAYQVHKQEASRPGSLRAVSESKQNTAAPSSSDKCYGTYCALLQRTVHASGGTVTQRTSVARTRYTMRSLNK